MQLSELSRIAEGRHLGADVSFGHVSTDSRSLRPGDLYVALVGERFDGNEFVLQAKTKGAIAAIGNKDWSHELPMVLVDDARLAFGQLAKAWREAINPVVIGITGSNGKTTTKEFVAALFRVKNNVLCTEGNLNNDVGVPLTLLRLTEAHQFAVVEMGANHLGEIAYTSNIVSPDIALITNAGSAHLEGFGSVEGVARAKGEVIDSVPKAGTVILNADDDFFDFWKESSDHRQILSFGFSSKADVRADISSIETRSGRDGTRLKIDAKGREFWVNLKLAGRHNIANALAAASAGIAAGLSDGEIATGLSSVQPVKGRMQTIRAPSGATIINDSYNANPSSFKAAIDVLTGFEGKLWLVLGAFAELGDNSRQYHHEIGEDARMSGIQRLFAVGEDTRHAAEAFGEGGCYFEQQSDLIEAVKESIDSDVVVLVKGSRSQRMDVVVSALMGQEPEE